MSIIRSLFALLLLAIPAQAQDAVAPVQRALMDKLIQEINGSLSCSADLIAARAKIADLESKLKKDVPPPAKE